MSDKSSPPPPGLSLGDIYYVLFRHKWKILVISTVGIIAAALLPFFWPRPYQSEAKLFIKYVVENKNPVQLNANDARVKSPDDRGENIINSELEILTSLDLAQEVATNIGPEKILGKGGGTEVYNAGIMIHKNLLPDVPKKSNVIRIVFQHSDPAVVQPVLSQLIELYLKRSAEVHRSIGVYDEFLNKQMDDMRSRLNEFQGQLDQKKTNGNGIHFQDAAKFYAEQMNKIQQEIYDATAELAERRAEANELNRLLNPLAAVAATNQPVVAITSTNSTSSNQPPAIAPVVAGDAAGSSSQASAQKPQAPAPVPSEQLADYKQLCTRLEGLEKKEQELLVSFTLESPLVKPVRDQIVECRTNKAQLEEKYPALVAVKTAETKTVGSEISVTPRVDLNGLNAKVTALEAKIRVLTNELEVVRSRAMLSDALQGPISDLERKKEAAENNFKNFSSSLDQARIDAALAAIRDSNISQIQAPSPPFRDSTKLRKAMLGLLAGAVAAALGFAFLIELYLDRSIRRPKEIELRLGLPLFISIPRLAANGNGNGKLLLLKSAHGGGLLPETTDAASGGPAPKAPGPILPPGTNERPAESPEISNGNGDHSETSTASGAHSSRLNDPGAVPGSTRLPNRGVPPAVPANPISKTKSSALDAHSSAPAPWEPDHALHPFWDALRDRLITYFEIKNLTHKPKLVAVTSCGDGSGVTTIAAGLAASLSETGDGNVLLVDMNQQQGAAHQFYKGNLALGLDDALESQKREDALVQDNLYVVKEATNGDKLPRVLPKRFTNLVPKLKASDYDYIIFDMPPISQISVTPHLARFMDIMFMVVESEKTDRDMVKRAADYLTEAKANVGIILNKTQAYVPNLLHQEL